MSEALKEMDKKIEALNRDTVRDLLAQCTESQQEFFLRLYPSGVDGMPIDKILGAIQLCERTIKNSPKKDSDQ